jgi:hypothetical protein
MEIFLQSQEKSLIISKYPEIFIGQIWAKSVDLILGMK